MKIPLCHTHSLARPSLTRATRLALLGAALGLATGTPAARAESLEVRAKSGTITEPTPGSWVITLHGVAPMARRLVPELPDNIERRAQSRIRTASIFASWSATGVTATQVKLSTKNTAADVRIESLSYDSETREIVIEAGSAEPLDSAAWDTPAMFGDRLTRPRLEFDREDLDVESVAPTPCAWCDTAPLGHYDNPITRLSLFNPNEEGLYWASGLTNNLWKLIGGPITTSLCSGASLFERFGISAYAKKMFLRVCDGSLGIPGFLLAWSNLKCEAGGFLADPDPPRLVEGEIVCSTGPHAIWPWTTGPGARGLSVPCRPGFAPAQHTGALVLELSQDDVSWSPLFYMAGDYPGRNRDGYWNYLFFSTRGVNEEIRIAGVCIPE